MSGMLIIARGSDHTELWEPADLNEAFERLVPHDEMRLYTMLAHLFNMDGLDKSAVLLLPQLADLSATLCEYSEPLRQCFIGQVYVCLYDFDLGDGVEVADWCEALKLGWILFTDHKSLGD